jgi:transketolase
MFDRFKEVAPERFFNCGIAESNMMSVAAGMALCGMRPVVYTITPFTTTRCLEQIKIGAAYHDVPVVIVGTGSGLSYAELGPTHHSLEDLAIIRAIPNINALAPADSVEFIEQLKEALDSEIPTYIRIGKKGEPLINSGGTYGIGKANMLKEGKEVLILAIGPIVSEAVIAARKLEKFGLRVAIANMGGVRPLDEEFLEDMSRRFETWVTLEEHGMSGGLGSSILEWLNENGKDRIKVKRIGTPNRFLHELGKQEYTREKLKIDSAGIVKGILEWAGI